MEKILGLINAPFTPFYENGEVNYEPIPAYAQMLAKNGLKGVFINGSSGEGYMLTEEERIKLTEAWVAAAPKDFKIIVHVGSTCVKSSRRMAEHAQKLGVFGIGAMAPPFPKSWSRRGTCKILRRDSIGSSRIAILLLPYSGIQRSILVYGKLLASSGR